MRRGATADSTMRATWRSGPREPLLAAGEFAAAGRCFSPAGAAFPLIAVDAAARPERSSLRIFDMGYTPARPVWSAAAKAKKMSLITKGKSVFSLTLQR